MIHDDFDQSFDGFDDEPAQPTSAPKKRRKARNSSEMEANLLAFEKEHQEEYKWIREQAATFEFAQSMRNAVMDFGDLTDGQRSAVQKCIERAKSFKVRQEARYKDAPSVDTSGVWAAFNRGVPALYLAANGRQFKLTKAKSWSKNSGSLYVSSGDAYLGKIIGEKFIPAKDCDEEIEADIYLAIDTPLASAIAYGKLTNRCSCCNRELTNSESIELGIGPICRTNYFG